MQRDLPGDFISWHIMEYVKDDKLQGHFKKEPKATYQITHSGNNKQSVQT